MRWLNWFHGCSRTAPPWAAGILPALDTINHKLESIMANMTDLTAAVARETDAENSVITLLQGISQQLKDAQAANDPAALDAAIAAIDANTARLSAAATANTTPPATA